MTRLFITGTDTGVGKTVVTGLLGHSLQNKGVNVITQKWCQCGTDEGTDIDYHDRLMSNRNDLAELRCPYVFPDPVSPHLASRLADTIIDPQHIETCLDELEKKFELVLIEGAGGLFVPLNEQICIIHMVATLQIPTIVVIDNRVGCINHSLLTIQALDQFKIPCVGAIISNCSENTNSQAKEDNPAIIEMLSGIPILGKLPYTKDLDHGNIPQNITDELNQIIERMSPNEQLDNT